MGIDIFGGGTSDAEKEAKEQLAKVKELKRQKDKKLQEEQLQAIRRRQGGGGLLPEQAPITGNDTLG